MEFFFVLSIAFIFLSPGINQLGEIYNEGLIWIAFVIAGGAYLIVHALKAVGLYKSGEEKRHGQKAAVVRLRAPLRTPSSWASLEASSARAKASSTSVCT